jgi:ERCC4-related helicase
MSLEATRQAAQEAKASIRVAVNKAVIATNEATVASKAAAKEAEDAAKYSALLIEDLAQKIDDTLDRLATTGKESIRLTVDTIKEQAKRAQEATIKAADWVKR